MKIFKTFILLFLVCGANLLSAQQMIKINDSSSHFISNSFLANDDSIKLKISGKCTHQHFTGKEDVYETTVFRNNGLYEKHHKLIDSNFLCVNSSRIKLDSTNFFEVGTRHDSGLLKNGTMWYTNSISNLNSIIYYPFLDSNMTNILIMKIIRVNKSVYIFGGYSFKTYPYNKSFVLKQNLYTNHWEFKTYNCFAAFCSISDAIYDSLNHSFIVISPARLGDTIAPYGGGIAKIDTNLNLIPNTAHKMEVNYQTWFTPEYVYDYSAALAWVNDTVFLTAGTVKNMQLLPSQNTNPNPVYDLDVAIGLRSSDSLQEINIPKLYGKLDTAENQPVGGFILRKIDSNLFVSVNNERYYTPFPEAWNTSLALFGVDAKGDKQWEYYMPYNDYCWTKSVHPTTDGGLWVVAQCSGNLNRNAGTYEYFAKVAFIDSIAYWPRKGTPVNLKEVQKKAADFVVYPNPTNGQLSIVQNGFITLLQYSLYDQSGRLVKEQKAAEHIVKLNLSDLSNGFYVLLIEDSKGKLLKTEKVVKQ